MAKQEKPTAAGKAEEPAMAKVKVAEGISVPAIAKEIAARSAAERGLESCTIVLPGAMAGSFICEDPQGGRWKIYV